MRWTVSLLVAVAIVLASFVLMLIMITPATREQSQPPVQMAQFIAMPSSSPEPPAKVRPNLPEPPSPPTEVPEVLQPEPPTALKAVVDVEPVPVASKVQIKTAPTPSLEGVKAEPKKQPEPKPKPQVKPKPATEAPKAAATPSSSSTTSSSSQAAADSKAQAPSAPAAEQPLGVSKNAQPTNAVKINYPKMAQRRGIQGYVKVGFVITKTGATRDIKILEASPKNIFDNEAKRVAALWKFTPGRQQGQPVEQRGEKVIEFKIQGRGR